VYSQDQIDNASSEELRSMVHDLTSALRDVRLSAAHYKLQYNMAVMESEEAASRMAVELAMAQREIDVLQQAEERRRANMVSPAQSFQESPTNPANAILLSELSRQCQILQDDNDRLQSDLDTQVQITQHREGELYSIREENDRLKTRIRKNRDHIAPFLGLRSSPFHDSGSIECLRHCLPKAVEALTTLRPYSSQTRCSARRLLLLLQRRQGRTPLGLASDTIVVRIRCHLYLRRPVVTLTFDPTFRGLLQLLQR
jgi:hypothetical protein